MTLHRGKIARTPTIGLIRPLTREDLALLREARPMTQHNGTAVVQRLRDPHHRIARLIAAGFRTEEVAARSGFSIVRVLTLSRDPAMIELVAKYRDKVNEKFVESIEEYRDLVQGNAMKAEVQVAERLEIAEEEGVPLPIRDLLAISRDAADRFGFGKRQMNVNVNVDFAAQLEKTIARSAIEPRAPLPVVHSTVEASLVPAYAEPRPSAHPSLPLIARRA